MTRRFGAASNRAVPSSWASFIARGPAAALVDRVILRHLPEATPNAQLLDIGCGSGYFLAEARRAGWQVTGVEPDLKAAQQARMHNLTIFHGTLHEWHTEQLRHVAPAQFDRITLSHVIEHVHDPAEVLGICQKHLHPRGTLWLETPNWASPSRLTQGAMWRGLEPPRHLVMFTPDSLQALLEQSGFHVKRWLTNPLAHWAMASTSPPGQAKKKVLTRVAAGVATVQRLFSDDTITLNQALQEPFITLEACRKA